jgi:hypothetical protein
VRGRFASLLLLPLLAGAALLPLRAPEAPPNPVERLQQQLEKGEVRIAYENGHGYLRGLLKALDVPEESQVLPFTSSSFLGNLINPKQPRAIYFNDDVAVSVAQGGRVVELITNGRNGGPAFYTFATARRGDPGFDHTDHATPFENRWGGWYVTGTTGSIRHHGNVTLPMGASDLPTDQGLNVSDLSGRFDARQVLQPGSDVVALMTLEHQAGFINRAAALNADYSDGRADDLAAYMTFAGEAALPGPIQGSGGFTARFAATGPRDATGRSLREHDLKTKLFRYPLSYMLYSNAFDALKPQAKARVWQQLRERLRATPEGRTAIAIAAATKPDVPAEWKTS